MFSASISPEFNPLTYSSTPAIYIIDDNAHCQTSISLLATSVAVQCLDEAIGYLASWLACAEPAD